MSGHQNEIGLFLGHFHPMLVHLPIGGLVLLGVLEVLATFPRFKDAAQSRRVILALVAAGSAAAAACGWLLAQSGGYDAQLLSWHRWTGLGVAGACFLTLLLCKPGWQSAYRLALLATLVLLVVAGHFGSEITHGRGFLSRYVLAAWHAMPGQAAQSKAAASAEPGQRQLYAEVVQPILQRRCVSCHGPEKQKGDLRLDSPAGMRHRGENGPALVAGKANESRMIQRLLLPLDQEEHMPPEGKPQPTPGEIGLLRWWINVGAPEKGTVSEFNPGADVLRMLEVVAARQPR